MYPESGENGETHSLPGIKGKPPTGGGGGGGGRGGGGKRIQVNKYGWNLEAEEWLEVKNEEKKVWPDRAKHVKICKRYPCCIVNQNMSSQEGIDTDKRKWKDN